jgi:hypothetical protein
LIGFEKFLRQNKTPATMTHIKRVWRNKVIFYLEIKIFDLSADETNNQILKTLIIM